MKRQLPIYRERRDNLNWRNILCEEALEGGGGETDIDSLSVDFDINVQQMPMNKWSGFGNV